MRFSLAALAAVLPFTSAYYKGFNVAAQNPDGSCKSQQQWTDAFNKLKAHPEHVTSVRVYASSDCGTLANAVPAAIAANVGLLVGVWATDETHFNNEKAALQQAITAHGSDWIIAISVGSEDLYRMDIDPATLVSRINDVRTMVRGMGVQKSVGHVDTWTRWINGTNADVIRASDFIGLNTFPYFEHASIDDAYQTFWNAVSVTRKQVNKISPGKWVWLTETGWPLSGASLGPAKPSVQNAQKYWTDVACDVFKKMHVFWYIDVDYNAGLPFGIFGKDGSAQYGLTKCA
ncbi:glycoside hydrolase family 17 protein [Piedraia hortae CBS 480.64]|uniref:Probable glucan endo-1,3-beta-glucosidase eglC n=1 Tax=Piedraia hortae CBS 480.64 TaxID=1314780 RepID=A0A6A7C542_9PEZI|nr:glycoside hydrolase family 17 protein [Piedraia hortae CBS 480.64]